jgi:hypothetical protein
MRRHIYQGVAVFLLVGLAQPAPADEVVQLVHAESARKPDRKAALAVTHRLGVPLASLRNELLARVQEFVTERAQEDGSLWRGAHVEPRALPVYRPDLEEPAYYEFKVAVEGKDAGYVLASEPLP